MPTPPISPPPGIAGIVRRLFGLPADAPLKPAPLLTIVGAVALLAGAYATAAGWLAPQRLTPQRIVTTLNGNFGEHPGYRRNHAKGVCVTGYFDGNGQAAAWSAAPVFAAQRTPVIGRFAVPGGNPAIADASTPVRSMALLFQLPGGEQWRTGMNNTPDVHRQDATGIFRPVAVR